MFDSTWIFCSRVSSLSPTGRKFADVKKTGDMGVPLPVICVARKDLTYRGSNTKAAIPSSNEYDGPYDWNKEATSFKSDKDQGQGMKQMCKVDLGSGDEDWEKVDGLGEEDEWTNIKKGDLA